MPVEALAGEFLKVGFGDQVAKSEPMQRCRVQRQVVAVILEDALPGLIDRPSVSTSTPSKSNSTAAKSMRLEWLVIRGAVCKM